MSEAIALIAAERQRQIDQEGFTATHDYMEYEKRTEAAAAGGGT